MTHNNRSPGGRGSLLQAGEELQEAGAASSGQWRDTGGLGSELPTAESYSRGGHSGQLRQVTVSYSRTDSCAGPLVFK